MINRLKKLSSLKKFFMICLILIIVVGSYLTIAYLKNNSSLNNQFVVASVDNSIEEDFDGIVKKDVSIKNTGDIDVYVRVKILPYFEGDEGNIIGYKPKINDDYTIEYSDNFVNDWFEKDGFYYYKNKLKSDTNTSTLFKQIKCSKIDTSKTFTFDILSESIQASSASAVNEAWDGIYVNELGQLEVAK